MKGGIPAETVKAMKGSKANAMPPKTVPTHGTGPSGSDKTEITLNTAGTYVSFKGTPKGPPKRSLPKPPYGMPTPR